MMTAYYCRGTKSDGSPCDNLLFLGALVEAVIQLTCKRSECGHHMNTIGIHAKVDKDTKKVVLV